MANGIGRVWAANAGDDEQRPNGVGSVWIENIDALAPSGGASEEQINELSAAIDYVSANAGDPNALTGYQYPGVVISAIPYFFDVSGNGFNAHFGEAGHFSANMGCSAVFTNGSKFIDTNGNFISADGNHGFVTSSNYHDLRIQDGGKLSAFNNASAIFNNGSLVSASNDGFLISASNNNRFLSANNYYGIESKYGPYDIKADTAGLDISSNNFVPLRYRNGPFDIKIADNSNGCSFYASSQYNKAWIDSLGVYGFSAGNYIGSFGCWHGNSNDPFASHYLDGVGFSSVNNTIFGVYGGGTLLVSEQGKLSANNGASVIFTNGSRTEITNGHVLSVGQNDKGTMNGIVVSGNGNEFIKIYNGGSVKAFDGAELNLSGYTNKIGQYLNASGSRFVSADGEGVSAWKAAPMTVMGTCNQTSSNAAFVIGNGIGANERSDLFVIDYSGNAKSNDFVAAPAPIVHTVTGTMTTSFTPPGVEQYYYEPILSGDIGVDLTKVSFNVDLSNLDDGLQQMIVYQGVDGSSVENLYNWYNNTTSFKQNLERPFSTSSTFTGYTSVEGDPSSLESVSSIRFVLDTDITIPYTATWTEEVAPKSLTELYNAFTAYTASHP